MSEVLNYTESRKTQSNKDFLDALKKGDKKALKEAYDKVEQEKIGEKKAILAISVEERIKLANVLGDVNETNLNKLLKKLKSVSVESTKPVEPKKDEAKKEEPKKDEAKKEEPKKEESVIDKATATVSNGASVVAESAKSTYEKVKDGIASAFDNSKVEKEKQDMIENIKKFNKEMKNSNATNVNVSGYITEIKSSIDTAKEPSNFGALGVAEDKYQRFYMEMTGKQEKPNISFGTYGMPDQDIIKVVTEGLDELLLPKKKEEKKVETKKEEAKKAETKNEPEKKEEKKVEILKNEVTELLKEFDIKIGFDKDVYEKTFFTEKFKIGDKEMFIGIGKKEGELFVWSHDGKRVMNTDGTFKKNAPSMTINQIRNGLRKLQQKK